MYSKNYRLKKKYQFAYCYRAGKSAAGKFMVVYAASSKNKFVKLGISVSKKVGGAVVRNRIKRKIAEALRLQIDNLSPNYNIVVVARGAASEASYQQLSEELIKLLGKLNVLLPKMQ